MYNVNCITCLIWDCQTVSAIKINNDLSLLCSIDKNAIAYREKHMYNYDYQAWNLPSIGSAL